MFVRSNSFRSFSLILLAALVLFTQSPDRAFSEDTHKEVRSFALLKGSCFDQRGLSLPGVAILVTLPPEETKKKKGKRWRMVSDRRGEFAVRLPSGERTFVVTAEKNGFEPSKKSVQFHYDEQQHIVIQMRPVSNSK